MKMGITPINDVIKQTNIVVFAPHFDDFLFLLGGYSVEMKRNRLLQTKNFHILLLFSRSNYLAGTGKGNFDTSLDRIKLATGKRLLEDMDCLNELLGNFNYRYELLGENECFARSKPFANSKMEFPHGMYEDFDMQDQQIFDRMQILIRKWANLKDTALIFPLAIKEHIDHFIVREAGIKVARELGNNASACFYFQEDKPYGGIADKQELERVDKFIMDNRLNPIIYINHPEKIIELGFKHYISQVEEVYREGICKRSDDLSNFYGVRFPCDRILAFNGL